LEGRIRDALAAPDRPGLHKLARQFGVGTVQRIAASGMMVKAATVARKRWAFETT
jgi:hypothetical protein